jgi:hypothetical protein
MFVLMNAGDVSRIEINSANIVFPFILGIFLSPLPLMGLNREHTPVCWQSSQKN